MEGRVEFASEQCSRRALELADVVAGELRRALATWSRHLESPPGVATWSPRADRAMFPSDNKLDTFGQLSSFALFGCPRKFGGSRISSGNRSDSGAFRGAPARIPPPLSFGHQSSKSFFSPRNELRVPAQAALPLSARTVQSTTP
eukprot:1182691-Prorocentrum_minimum.AAC.1